MIKTIVALFALYESSLGNRLLLQAVPPAVPEPVPPAVPAMPVAPEPPVAPVAPQPPVTIPEPIAPPVAPQPPPVTPQPPAVVPPPVQPQPPVTPPGRPLFPWELPPQPIGPPVSPTNPIAPIAPIAPPVQPQPPMAPPVPPTNPIAPPVTPPGTIPQPPAVGGPQPGFPWQRPGFLSTKLECKVSPPNPASCAGGMRTITNPSENYEILCTAPRGGCYGTTLNIELTPMGYPIDRLKLFAFIGEYAAMNAKINIRNTRGDQVRLDEVKCDKMGACQNLQITMDPGIYIEQGDFYCTFGACDGCTINGVPCYYYVEPI